MRDGTSDARDPIERLRRHIADEGFARGSRLSPERQLREVLGLSRATLRKALDALEREGQIRRHVGKGTVIADGTAPARVKGAAAEPGRQLTPFRMVRAHLAIDLAIARDAAVNASGETLQKMRRAIERARAATTWKE